MVESVLFGFVTGLLLSCTFGTVFFSLVQSSVDNGYRSGIKIALGVLVCDLIFVFFALFGTAYLPDIPDFDKWMAGAGGLFLTGIGLSNLLKQKPRMVYPRSRLGSFVYYFSTGFLLNGLNPVNFIAWATLATYVHTTLHYDLQQSILFFGAAVLTIFLTESLIAVFAHRLQRFFTERIAYYFNKLTGVVFIGIALRLFFTVILDNS